MQVLENNRVVIMNEFTGEVVYRPPESEVEIRNLLSKLEVYMNTDDGIDPLIKLAIIHYQFKSIHPFYDGNGRTCRIINILYLIMKNLIDAPIIFFSKYIMENKSNYYRLLKEVQTNGNWEEWILYILKSIKETANESLELLVQINNVIADTINVIKENAPKIYSYKLVELIFSEFYTRIGNFENILGVARKTAATYLNKLVDIDILDKETRGRENVYINKKLIEIFTQMNFS